MSREVVFFCDWCGEQIDGGAEHWAALRVHRTKSHTLDSDAAEWDAHYHDEEHRDCWDRCNAMLQLTLDQAGAIDRIPTATGQKIAALRRAHRMPTADRPREADWHQGGRA